MEGVEKRECRSKEKKKNAGRNVRRNEKNFGFPTNPTVK